MENPLVTVYITNYNYANYCEKAIESVLSQSFSNYELLIFDDGSTDESRDILQKYSDFDNVSLFFQENIGLNKTNNLAVNKAKGKYIVRLDADDWFTSNLLEIMVADLEGDKSLALVFPDYYEVDEHGNMIRQIRRHDFSNGVSMLDQPAHGACTMFRMSALVDVGGYSEDFKCQDGVDIWLKIIEKYNVKNINSPLFYYRQHAKSLTKNDLRILQTRCEIYKQSVEKKGLESKNVVAVIPVRSDDHQDSKLALTDLGNKKLIDWTVDSAINSETISKIIVSTSSKKIKKHLEKYGDAIEVVNRENESSGGPSLVLSLIDVLDGQDINIDALLVLSFQAPFRSSFYNDTAVYTMQLFDADVVDGVVIDENIFYYHDGHGLRLWQEDQEIRHERDTIYRRSGGINLISSDFLKRERKAIGGKMGHVVLDQKSALTIRSTFDLEIAKSIVGK